MSSNQQTHRRSTISTLLNKLGERKEPPPPPPPVTIQGGGVHASGFGLMFLKPAWREVFPCGRVEGASALAQGGGGSPWPSWLHTISAAAPKGQVYEIKNRSRQGQLGRPNRVLLMTGPVVSPRGHTGFPSGLGPGGPYGVGKWLSWDIPQSGVPLFPWSLAYQV